MESGRTGARTRNQEALGNNPVIGSKPPAEIKELMLQKAMMNSATLSPPKKSCQPLLCQSSPGGEIGLPPLFAHFLRWTEGKGRSFPVSKPSQERMGQELLGKLGSYIR